MVDLEKLSQTNSIVLFDPECVRKKSNWSKSGNEFKFDADEYNPEQLRKALPSHSPKLNALLDKIKALDKADMKRDGHHYKHFIFCDLKSSNYGAKLLASAFIANDFHMGYKALKKSDVKPAASPKEKMIKVREDTPRPPMAMALEKMPKVLREMEEIVEDEEEEEESPIIEMLADGKSVSPKDGESTRMEEMMEGGAKKDSPKQKRFRKIELLDNSELKNTTGQNFYLLSSVDVFDQPISVAMKKQMLRNFNERPANIHGEEVRFIIMDSGFKEGIDLFDIRYVHIFEPSVNSADQKQVVGRGTRTCGQQGLTFHPTRGWPLHVFVYDLSIPEQMRSQFLDSESTFDLYIKSLNMDIRLARFTADLEKTSIYGAVDHELNEEVHQFSITDMGEDGELFLGGGPKGKGPKGKKKPRIVVDYDLPPIVVNTQEDSVAFMSDPEMQITLPSGQIVSGTELKHMDFRQMRDYIRKYFKDCAWEDVKMENGCVQRGGGGKVIDYTPTQRFIKRYFTPQCPVKGMLLWHSTGTGKTCSAIASATSSFDPQGYTILWVTRTTLKNDIWKNMFDQICNEQIRKMVEDGIVLPEEHAKRMRMLSKAWRIRPMSYKQFSNLVSKENDYYRRLVDINGAEDPLRKTLLVIDEAHKLYGGGDLSSLERPDMDALHKALMHSYSVSGRNSARLLLMTATPITENPMELVKLVNLCKMGDQQMPSEFGVFSDEYLNEEGVFHKKGEARYLDEIAGHISYLNREKDARQFAQPKLHRVDVPLVKNVQEVAALDKKYARSLMNKEIDVLKKRVEEENAKMDKDLEDLDATRFYAIRDLCEEYEGVVKKGCLKIASVQIRALVKEAKEQSKELKDGIKKIREEIKNKKLFRKEALAKISEHIKTNPNEMEQFEKGIYYVLKYKCGKNVSSNNDFEEAASQHPVIAEINSAIDGYNKRIQTLEEGIQGKLDAHKSKIKEVRKLLRTQLNELERSVVKSVLKDLQKEGKGLKKELAKRGEAEKTEIEGRQKSLSKKRRKTLRKIKSVVKEVHRDQKYENKEKARAEKTLRKTLRKQGLLREEFKDGILKDLVGKYSKRTMEEFKTVREGLELAEKVKREEREKKEAVKSEKAREKEAKAAAKRAEAEAKYKEKQRIKTQKAREKAEAKAEKAREKARKKALRKTQKLVVPVKLIKFNKTKRKD